MRKKKQKRKKQIIIGLLIIIFFSFAIFGLVTERQLFFLEGISRDLLLSPNAFLVSHFSNNCVCESHDQTLKLEKEELQKEIDELKEMIDIKSVLSDKVIVSANVIHRNLGYFYETLTINKGNKDGITDGMAVIASTGLIGKTKNVTEHYSDVLLLTSPKVGTVSIKIKSGQDYAYGLLTAYDENKKIYKIEGISSNIPIGIGEEVTTTGMGDIFPSGILIGTVSSISTDHFDLTQIIEVAPAVNINDFSVVSILKRNVNNE